MKTKNISKQYYTYFSVSFGDAEGGGVFRLLKAFNHLFFMLPVDAEDIFLSRPESADSSLFKKSSFCKKK